MIFYRFRPAWLVYFIITVLFLSYIPKCHAESSNRRYHDFFPVYRKELTELRDGVCRAEFENNESPEDGLDWTNICNEVLDCMLDNMRESTKGNMASGVVLLGLMPTLLTFLGSSTDECVLLSRRRPVLAFLIACGSPSVFFRRTFEYSNPVTELKSREGPLVPVTLIMVCPALVTLVEYALVIGAVANVYETCYRMGEWAINSISCTDNYYPLLWAVITIFIHIGGMLAMWARVATVREGDWGTKSWFSKLSQWLRHEFTPCITHEKLVLQWKKESYLFVALSWLISVGMVAHVLYGTLAFSSIHFIGHIDSIKLIGRIMGSAVVCRAVLMFELNGMRNALEDVPQDAVLPEEEHGVAEKNGKPV